MSEPSEAPGVGARALSRRREALAVVLLWLPLLLLPLGRSAELPILIGACIGLYQRLRGASIPTATDRLILVAFLGYWLPEFFSAFDSYAPTKSWSEALLDLRYLPFLWFAALTLTTTAARVRLAFWSMWVIGLWILDALVQAATGVGLGGAMNADRLSGIFSDDNLKLGPVIAVLTPLWVLNLLERHGRRAAVLGLLLAALVVLLAGARGGWICLAVVALALLAHLAGSRRRFAWGALMATVVMAVIGGGAYFSSDRFAARIDRSMLLFSTDRAALETALAYRVSIFETALNMSAAHPLNGVGVRAFRDAYIEYAPEGDAWLAMNPGIGAFHAHQWLLEVGSETGLLGLLCWCLSLAWLARAFHRESGFDRHRAMPYAIALSAMLFPLNTHFAFYSGFWSNLYFWLLAAWLAHSRAGTRE